MNRFKYEARTAPSELTSFALLRMDQTRILIPQTDIRVLELTMDISLENPPAGGVGWISFRNQQHPVYSPSAKLEWLTTMPDDRLICALMEADEGAFGLLCNEVILVKSNELIFHAMPAAMASPDSPFSQLAMHAEVLACLSSATKLFAQLPPQGSNV